MNTRRVIFPPPDYWTHPHEQENTVTENPPRPDAGDYRRAALLTKYRRQGNKTGQVAIVEEVNETNRSPQLLRALLVLHTTFITRFRTPDGVDLLADYFNGIASLEPIDAETTDTVRAAQIIEHFGHNDHPKIARVMNTVVSEGRAMQTILALLDHYEVA
ncbi:hypothetical protein, partial [Mycobacterium asiaticum]|uniref:hypothetical protein n=1 Tax=Mycobacterium asiaticum TaxID=1790 RepID=UPI0007EF7B5F